LHVCGVRPGAARVLTCVGRVAGRAVEQWSLHFARRSVHSWSLVWCPGGCHGGAAGSERACAILAHTDPMQPALCLSCPPCTCAWQLLHTLPALPPACAAEEGRRPRWRAEQGTACRCVHFFYVRFIHVCRSVCERVRGGGIPCHATSCSPHQKSRA